MCYFAPMTQADRIRQFALDRYVVPARTRNAADVVIRAGDVHREMALFSAMPAVCSAIGSRKFEEVSGATIVKRTGPTNGANVYFHVSLVAVPHLAAPPVPISRPGDDSTEIAGDVDLTNSIALVSCVKNKHPYPAPARSLYTSAWFHKARDLVEASGARWFVLSSRYGLVAPETNRKSSGFVCGHEAGAFRCEWPPPIGRLMTTKPEAFSCATSLSATTLDIVSADWVRASALPLVKASASAVSTSRGSAGVSLSSMGSEGTRAGEHFKNKMDPIVIARFRMSRNWLLVLPASLLGAGSTPGPPKRLAP